MVFLYDIDELYVFTLHIEHILNLFFVERQFSGTPTVEGRRGQVVSVIGAVIDVSSIKASQRSSMPSPSSHRCVRDCYWVTANGTKRLCDECIAGHFKPAGST